MDAIAEIVMENLPPKNLKNQLVRLDHNLKQIERKHYAGIQRAQGSLPVLEAFQEFLENERRAARRKMQMLSVAYLLLFLAVLGGAGTFVYLQMSSMSEDYSQISSQTDQLASELAAKTESASAARQSLASRHEQLVTTQSNTVAQLEKEAERIESLEKTLNQLSSENVALKSDLERAMRDWPEVEAKVDAFIDQYRVWRTLPGASTAIESSAPLAFAANDMADNSVNLTIVPPGAEHGIRWRLPVIPE